MTTDVSVEFSGVFTLQGFPNVHLDSDLWERQRVKFVFTHATPFFDCLSSCKKISVRNCTEGMYDI